VPRSRRLQKRQRLPPTICLTCRCSAPSRAGKTISARGQRNGFSRLHLEGSFRLSYNGSMFAKEGWACF
jgi:hypothetical protein